VGSLRVGPGGLEDDPGAEGVAMTFEEAVRGVEAGSGAWCEQPVGADLDEAVGEHVLEEAGDEAIDGEGAATRASCTRLDPAEGDGRAVERLDGAVGEGDAER
jgi:hypothetical protein